MAIGCFIKTGRAKEGESSHSMLRRTLNIQKSAVAIAGGLLNASESTVEGSSQYLTISIQFQFSISKSQKKRSHNGHLLLSLLYLSI